MQLSKSLFLDVEIVGLNKKLNLQYKDLVDLEIIETAGASLPVLYMSFLTTDKSVKNYILQNNEIKVRLGETEANADTFIVQAKLNNPAANNPAGDTYVVEFGGFLKSSAFMDSQETKTYLGNSLLVTIQLLQDTLGYKPGEGFRTSITRTNENQVKWRRHNEQACTFLANTLVHMDIMPGIPLFAFDKYCTFHLNDLAQVLKQEPVASFVPFPPRKSNEIQYFNTFTVDSYRDEYNLYSGYNKVSEIYGVKTGMPRYEMGYNEPVLSATQESEKIGGISRASIGIEQSSNVHNTYASAFAYNTNMLMALSSITGVLDIYGVYPKSLKPTDVVSITTGGDDPSLDGRYLIDTIRTKADMSKGLIHTYVYVTRDNVNNIENFIANPRQGIKIRKKFMTDLLNALADLRYAYAIGKKIVDGTYMKKVLSFAIATKTNLLRSFVVAGVRVDLNDSKKMLQSLICVGNSLMNTLTSMIFPEQVAWVFRDFIIRKPSLKTLLSNYIAQYVPYEAREIIWSLIDSIFTSTSTLNYIGKDNGISITGEEEPVEENMPEVIEEDYTENSQEKINNIIRDFENNTTGLDIPFPILELTEAQSLFPDDSLRKYIADQTILNLTNLGYLEEVDKDKFEDILLGKEPIDFAIIEQINKNVGETSFYRIWGTFNDFTEITDFFLKKSFKDKYKAIACTKLINAMDNAKVFFACPSKEENLKFYINSKRVEVVEELTEDPKLVLLKFEMDLGYKDPYGDPLLYTIYATNNGFNSTSVLLEVRQGG